ncbi:phosphatase [Arthrobacter castelli]|uniref:phosphatase n=1 Tax=Arthrobacter castelli TaxID=271431 RepID=UPI00040C7CD6|nr:phosphatase [Arthrobacter castelli]
MNSQQLEEYLDSVRITGHVATPREVNVRHIHRFIDGAEDLGFGVRWSHRWTYDDVFELMHHRVGTSSDQEHRQGQDTISARLCVAALDRFAARLAAAAAKRETLLFATGHPAGLLPVHAALAQAMAGAGCPVAAIPAGIGFDAGDIRQINHVVMWHQHGSLMHTHLPVPMESVLARLQADGGPLPDLVVADHGWAGHAAEAGIDAMGFADCNDPGLFVSEAQGQLQVAVPLDDNVSPQLYEPMIDYVLERSGLN